MKLMCKKSSAKLIKECSAVFKYNTGKDQEIIFGRPLSERLDKEVYYYCKLKGLFGFNFDSYSWIEKFYTEKMKRLPGSGNMNKLLNELIVGL